MQLQLNLAIQLSFDKEKYQTKKKKVMIHYIPMIKT